MIGEIIAGYKIEYLINEGGMGAVYFATHTQIGKKAAIKVLKQDFLQYPNFKERFQNEARLMANLNHPNLVALYQYEESAKGLFLIMEYVEGKSLKEMLQAIKKPMEEAQAIDLFKQILAAFEYAHHEKLVHRDVKPANIMVDKKGQAKVLDFGIAKALDTDNEMTMTGTQMGTLKYMSPEQVHDSKRIDQRSDIYSLGVTLYTLLSNSTPYDRMESRLDIQIAIAKDMLPNIRSINPKVSEQTAQTIQKATAKKPEDRFRSCKDFKEALMASSFKREQIKNTPSSSFGSEQETIIDTPNSYPPKQRVVEETILGNQNKNLSEEKLKETLRKMAKEQSSKGSATSTPKKNTGKNFFTSKVKIALGLIVGIGIMLFLANRFASTSSGGYESENYQEVGGETKADNTNGVYQSYNYYGNGVTEYIGVDGKSIYYTSTKLGNKVYGTIKNVLVDAPNHKNYDMNFPNVGYGNYGIIIQNRTLTVVDSNGDRQIYNLP